MVGLTHLDDRGRAQMVDVAGKAATHRVAVAEGWLEMNPATLERIVHGEHAKGDVVATARVAGIMAAKKTAELVPLCHPLALTRIAVELQAISDQSLLRCVATVETVGPTGVEMEALTAVQIALLTVYDMCKAADRGMTIRAVRLLEKRGGRSGHWRREPKPPGVTHVASAADVNGL